MPRYTVGIFTGILAKEAVVGTLKALYSQMAEPELQQEDEAFDLQLALLEAFATIPDNLAFIADNILDPLGLNIGDVSSIDSVAAEQEGAFKAMQSSFDGQVGLLIYYLFYSMRPVLRQQQQYIENPAQVGRFFLYSGSRV